MGKHKRKRSPSSSPSQKRSNRDRTRELEKRLRILERHFGNNSSPDSRRRASKQHSSRDQYNSRGDRSSRYIQRSSTPVRSLRDSTSYGLGGFTPPTTSHNGSEGFTPSPTSHKSENKENAPPPNIDSSILVVNEPGLDEEVLKCLGEDPEDGKIEGFELHKALSPRWQNILAKGFSKESKLELIEKYPVPGNCPGLQTPTLNPEIAQAVSDMSLKKDKYQVAMQTQLSAGITSLGKAMTMILVDESDLAKSLIPILSDSGKLLTDLFHYFSIQRRSFLTPQLNQLAMKTAKTSSIDAKLFGSDFGERLKIAKEIEKSSKDLKINKTSALVDKSKRSEWKVPSHLNSKGPSRGRRDLRQYGQSRNRKQFEPTYKHYRSSKRNQE